MQQIVSEKQRTSTASPTVSQIISSSSNIISMINQVLFISFLFFSAFIFWHLIKRISL
jgi:membrane protein required for beta-lactamase induction